ncbi:AMP-binding protein [Parachitinimonas caeni]|uniref:AMP-binding protein n=1 Tax=Parachitinimonas caeni TaxID=3031301 RepID=A0ABT7DTS3_9NEIS|nr:AMP-binding protein [Parachitinimonas caeni]MDK2123468.1 AMP-binding protein [Parachitinimonas caeni]
MTVQTYIEEVLQAIPQANGLLFHALKDGNSAYHIGVAFRLRAEVSAEVIHATWHRIQQAQPALRSVFAWQGLRTPHQLIFAQPRIALAYSAQGLDGESEQVGQPCLDWLAQSKATAFDLNREVFRIACFHDVAAGTLDMAFSFHHILMDGWSSSLLISLWVRGLRGQPLQPLAARQYSQQLWSGLEAQALQQSRAYWESVLVAQDDSDGTVGTLLLAEPLFRAANADSAAQTGQRISARSHWLTERKQAVEALCRQAGVTPASFFYLCWALTLAKLTFQQRVAFGCAFSGREAALAQAAEDQPLGLFTNTVPLVLSLDSQWSLADALQAVFRSLQQAQQHEKTPPLVVREAAGQRAELYDTLVVFDNYPIEAGLQDAACGVHLTALHSEESTHFGLTLTISGIDDWQVELGAGDHYAGEPAAVPAVLAAFEALADDLAALPAGASVAALPLKLATAETGAASLQQGPVKTQLPDINQLLERIYHGLQQSPQAVRLVDGERPVSNAELLAAIARWQGQLRQAGFVAGDRVAVHLPKGLASTAAILAILFSGGSYCYLNPKDPAQRKQTLLTMTGCSIVIGGESLRAELGAEGGYLLLSAVAEPAAESVMPTLWRQRRADGEFYFIFTSGTTGTPKGIAIRNESVANLLDWFVADTGLSAADRVLGLTDLNFDPSVEDLFASLLVGATVVYPAPQIVQERQAFIDLMQREAISVVNFIPGAIAELIAGAPFLPAMRLWIFGGEALPRRLRDELLQHGYAVANHYGPSETTVDCLSARQSLQQDIAIGWPIQNAVAYCADVFGQVLPAGVRGELRVGGLPVARGYASNPLESARNFVMFAQQPFYRTGDAVLFQPALGFCYLGRIDDQVKINGVRIEPRELERVVELLPAVKASCLLPVTLADGRRQWQLFIDSAETGEDRIVQLRAHIRQHLPEAWMPARITRIDGFARTPTGKIDRRQLLAQAVQAVAVSPAAASSRCPVEAQVQAIWAAVLESDAPATDVNFFDAGGNSLKIIALQSQLQQAFGRDIGVAVLFEHPTIAAFAAWIKQADNATAEGAPASPSQDQTLSSARSGRNRLAERRSKAKESAVS